MARVIADSAIPVVSPNLSDLLRPPHALLARVRSMLRQKALHDTVHAQAERLTEQARQLETWNQTLEARVAEQIREIERVIQRQMEHSCEPAGDGQ